MNNRSEWQMKVTHKFKFDIWFTQQDNLLIYRFLTFFTLNDLLVLNMAGF